MTGERLLDQAVKKRM